MVGPWRGLRTAEPVHTNPALVHVVVRSGALFDGTDGAALVFGSTSGSDELREEAQAIGAAEIARRADLPVRTVERYVSGERTPKGEQAAKFAAAVLGVRERHGVGCAKPIVGRSDRRWCTNACWMAHHRQKQRTADRPAASDNGFDQATAALLDGVEGLDSLGPAVLAASPRLRPAIEAALSAGWSPEDLAGAVATLGTSWLARSPWVPS